MYLKEFHECFVVCSILTLMVLVLNITILKLFSS